MWEWNYIYGAILIKDFNKSFEIIESLKKDKKYPFINTNMFNFGETEIPYYYDDIILTFGATYKNFGYEKSEWKIFILKMEHLLRSIGFKSAQFHASGVFDQVTLSWYNIEDTYDELHKNYHTDTYDFYKTNEWYFGYGKRNLHFPELISKKYSKLDIEYPINYNKDIIREFADRI
ncbi:hypothetical protein [uncultured Dokdonia sp.]|uniref:hypothetical protein n=1 Tax=uncultured Dokdonia sp. TaxID=575653 RepID=UPI00261ECC8D|nr:hypothetical protein [uncultured Dokdonia sp.]